MGNYESIMEDINKIGKRCHQHNIVSTVAFLIGVPEAQFQEGDPHALLYGKLRNDKNARIIHYLCQARTAIWKNYKDLEHRSKAGEGVYSWGDVLPDKLLTRLSSDGASFVKGNTQRPYELIFEINRLICERINNCKSLFPQWLNWEYIKSLFIIEDSQTYQGCLAAAKKYYSKSYHYPYGYFINWEADNYGHILFSDLHFCIILYGLNGDRLSDYGRCSDIRQESKDEIYSFINSNEKILMLVDCENSDPYRLSSVLQGLDAEQTRKIQRIVLFDDVHTTPAWGKLKLFMSKRGTTGSEIPVDHKMTERIHAGKSIVDMEMALSAQASFLSGEADAFIICSSDSDYWTLIRALPNARFLLLVERAKCSEVLKNALSENDIFYCYMDDFYAGDKDMERVMLNQSMRDFFASEIDINFRKLFDRAIEKTRISLTDSEREGYFKKLVNGLNVTVDETGKLCLETAA